MKHVLLLRGVNVGTSVRISMPELRGWLGGIGLSDVITYLNSGNALFESPRETAWLTDAVSAAIADKCGQPVPVLVKPAADMRRIAAMIPGDWQNDGTQQTYVAYLFGGIAAQDLIEELPVKRQYIEFIHGNGAIVWNIRRENYNRSQITRLAGHPAYAAMTTRNVNTARKLAALCGWSPGDQSLT